MPRSVARARAGRERTSLYQEITHKIITVLEAGRVPWVQPWGTVAAKAPLTMPKNAATHRHYSGINVLILWGAVIDRGFSTQNWLTFRQALRLGDNVRKGERGTTVLYADHFVPDEERRRAERDGGEPNAIRFLKRFTVFNTDQCEDLPREAASAPSPIPEGLVVAQAESLIAATGADFRMGCPGRAELPPCVISRAAGADFGFTEAARRSASIGLRRGPCPARRDAIGVRCDQMSGHSVTPICTQGFLFLRPMRAASCVGYSIFATSSSSVLSKRRESRGL
jgi:hypothetical protein